MCYNSSVKYRVVLLISVKPCMQRKGEFVSFIYWHQWWWKSIKCKKKNPNNSKALSLKRMLAANSFKDHKMHHSSINRMHKVLTAIKMSEVLTSVLKMWGPALKQSIILNHKICKLQSSIYQVLFKLIKQRNSKSRLEFFPELTQRQTTANCY